MKFWHSIALGSLLSFSPGLALGEQIEISYSWTMSQQVISTPGGNQIIPVYLPLGTVSAPVDSKMETVIPGIIWDASSPPNTWREGDFNAKVNATLILTDVASGRSTHLDYQVGFTLEGVGPFRNLYVSETPGSIETLRLGNYLYRLYPDGDVEPVSVGSSYSQSNVTPSSLDLLAVAGIGPVVRVSYAPGVQTPEPSSLALSGIAALGLALARRYRGRADARGVLSSSG